MKDQHLPGQHVTDRQMRLYMSSRHTDTPAVAAAKAGFSTTTAYRIEGDPHLSRMKLMALLLVGAEPERGYERTAPIRGALLLQLRACE
jgi:hypothetical protein